MAAASTPARICISSAACSTTCGSPAAAPPRPGWRRDRASTASKRRLRAKPPRRALGARPMSASADRLVVMARSPVPGEVKTRLATAVGAEAACALYRAFLADLAARFGGGPWSLIWAVTPPDADLGPLVGQRGVQIPQEGDDLAERMHRVFTRLSRDGAKGVVMIGADAPHVADAALAAAFAALEVNDAVLMPTRDGGYCLVGLRAPHDI